MGDPPLLERECKRMLTQFNPVQLSNQENEFLLKHLGTPSIVALKEIKGVLNPNAPRGPDGRIRDSNPYIYPDGVIPSAVKPVLDGVLELQELEKHEGLKWVGIEKIKDAIRVWFRENQKWSDAHARTRGRAPRFPSLYAWDAKGKGHRAGPESDAGEVKTYFGPAGERIPFAIDLIYEDQEQWTPPLPPATEADARLYLDSTRNRIECRVPLPDGTLCGHTENYQSNSRRSYNTARARMSKHLRKATVEVEAHRELHTLEYGN